MHDRIQEFTSSCAELMKAGTSFDRQSRDIQNAASGLSAELEKWVTGRQKEYTALAASLKETCALGGASRGCSISVTTVVIRWSPRIRRIPCIHAALQSFSLLTNKVKFFLQVRQSVSLFCLHCFKYVTYLYQLSSLLVDLVVGRPCQGFEDALALQAASRCPLRHRLHHKQHRRARHRLPLRET